MESAPLGSLRWLIEISDYKREKKKAGRQCDANEKRSRCVLSIFCGFVLCVLTILKHFIKHAKRVVKIRPILFVASDISGRTRSEAVQAEQGVSNSMP